MVKRYLKTIAPDDAVKRFLEYVEPIADEEYLPVNGCVDRVTTRPVYALISNPPFICSAMDGYAVCFEKTAGADITSPLRLEKGREAFRVNTGDPMPPATDAVVMVEDVEEDATGIVIRRPLYLWQHVRMVGEDIIAGDMLIPSNHVIGVFDVGMLISGGIQRVHVRRRPKILIIPTGKELIDLFTVRGGGTVDPREIDRGMIDFNSYTLLALSESIGFVADKTEIVCDEDKLHDIVYNSVEDNDVIVINAGTSAGSEDFTETIIQGLGTVIFHGIGMMPGKPAICGIVRGKPVFGIPGYPVSAVLSFQTFIEPLYERLMLVSRYKETLRCVIPFKIPSRIGVEEIMRVRIWENPSSDLSEGNRFYALPLPRGASIFSSLARADGLLQIPEQIEGCDEGEELTCTLMCNRNYIKNRIHIIGSHDISLDVLRDMVKSVRPGMDLVATHTGSLSGIIAVQKGISPICTTHIYDEKEDTYNIPIIKQYIPSGHWRLIHVAKRIQGLLVRKGNPKQIRGVQDLGREGIRFINRQSGSGTRILLDLLLKQHGIGRGSIQGYDREESSHTAVGVLVKEGIADTGLAIYSVAKMFSLDFIELAEEDYDILVTEEFTRDDKFTILMEILLSEAFRDRLGEIGGYITAETGRVKYVN